MGRWNRMMHKVIVSEVYHFISLTILLAISAGFISYRAAVVNTDNKIFYLWLHVYWWLSAFAAWLFYSFYNTFIPILDRNRRQNGEVNWDISLWLIMVGLIFGLFSFPLYIFLQNRDRENIVIVLQLYKIF